MKAYVVNVTMVDVTPSVWRQVVMPADVTFNRLHEMIQHVMNFQSTIVEEQRHFFKFSLKEEGLLVTNDPGIHAEYKQNKKKFGGTIVKQSTRLKIDTYLEKYKELHYTYGVNDSWRIHIGLESIVDDYYFGYPTLLNGVGTAPPEDVLGPQGFEQFLQIYHDPTHPDYLAIHKWSEKQRFRFYDRDMINSKLKLMNYKKNEWAQIDHQNYVVLSDKYRGSDVLNVESIEQRKLIIDYVIACTHLYGIVPMYKIVEIYNKQNKETISIKVIESLLHDKNIKKQLEARLVHVNNASLIHESLKNHDTFTLFKAQSEGKPFYVPMKEELLRYVDEKYMEKNMHIEQYEQMLMHDFYGGSNLMVGENVIEVVKQIQIGYPMTKIFGELAKKFNFIDDDQVRRYMQVVTDIANYTRLWGNRGHTAKELFDFEQSKRNTIVDHRVGRNEPCTCGSGKKYKKCCAK